MNPLFDSSYQLLISHLNKVATIQVKVHKDFYSLVISSVTFLLISLTTALIPCK